jgi:hypothetical protein
VASNRHDFIVAAISRKIRQYGFNITYLDGRYQDISEKKFDFPPQLIHHKPDIIGEKNAIFCIGEAKTENDIQNQRTKNQIKDFFSIICTDKRNKLILGIPLKSKTELQHLLHELGLSNQKQIEIIYIPEEIMPNEEKV